MVVGVLILTCFLKLAGCSPYVSPRSNVKLPAPISFASNVPPGGNTNHAPDTQPYSNYNYNIPLETTQPAEEMKVNIQNKPRSKSTKPLPMPERGTQNKYMNLNRLNPGLTESNINFNYLDDPAVSKLVNDVPSLKYKPKPFSANLNSIRENFTKTTDSSLKNISPATSALVENTKSNDAGALNKIPQFTETQIPPLVTQPNLSGLILRNATHKSQQNEITRDKIIMPENAVKYEDYNTKRANDRKNGTQMPKMYQNDNNNPFIQNTRDKYFDKFNRNSQPMNIAHNLPYVVNGNVSFVQPSMQPLNVSSLLQKVPLEIPTRAPTNENLEFPYKVERNMSNPLRQTYNKFYPLHSKDLNQTFISHNEIAGKNLNNSLPLQTSMIPYYNMVDSKTITQPIIPSEQSLLVESFVKVNQTDVPEESTHSTLSYYNDMHNTGPKLQSPGVKPLKPHENASVIGSSDIITQPAHQVAHQVYDKEGNMSQIYKAYNYNTNEPFLRTFTQQLSPRTQLYNGNQLQYVHPPYNSIDRNVSQMHYIPSGPQEMRSDIVKPQTSSSPMPVLLNQENYVSQTSQAPNPSNFNQVNAIQFTQQPTRNNQSLKEDLNSYSISITQTPSLSIPQGYPLLNTDDILTEFKSQSIHIPREQQQNSTINIKTPDPVSSAQIDMNINLHTANTVPSNSIPTTSQDYVVENNRLPILNEQEGNEYKTFDVNSYNTRIRPQYIASNQLSKENQFENMGPLTPPATNIKYAFSNQTINHDNVSQIQPISVQISDLQQNSTQIVSPEIIKEAINFVDLDKSEVLVGDAAHHKQLKTLPKLPSQPQENLLEYVQLIDDSENMRTKNSIALKANNPPENKYNDRQSHNNYNILFNSDYQTSRISSNNRLNSYNSQSLKTNSKIPPQETNYDIVTDRILNKSEPLMQLNISQPYDKNSVPTNSLNRSPDDVRINSKVTELAYNGKEYGSQPLKVPYYNSLNPFINALNRQTLYKNEIAGDNRLIKPNQEPTPKQEVTNSVGHNDVEKESDSPTKNLTNQKDNTVVKKEINELSHTQTSTKYSFLSSWEVGLVENDSQRYLNSNETQITNDLLNDTAKVSLNNLNKVDININIPKSESVDNIIPFKITIEENSDEPCTENHIIINLENEIEKPSLNAIQNYDEITSKIDVFIPRCIEKADITKENKHTNSTEEESKLKDVLPNVEFDNFSVYLADTILSSIQTFLKHSNGELKKNTNIEDKNDFYCNKLETTLQNACKNKSEISNKIKETMSLIQNIEEVSSPPMETNSKKYQCFESDEVKNDVETKVIPSLKPYLSSNENEEYKMINEKNSLSTISFQEISSVQYNNVEKKEERGKVSKSSCACSNETPNIYYDDKNLQSNTLSLDDYVLDRTNGAYELCFSSKPTNQVDDKPLIGDENEDTLSNQSIKILLPYYYYTDSTSTPSNVTNQSESKSNIAGTSKEVQTNDVISPPNGTPTTLVGTDSNPEVTRAYGPKPCLSKITVNILPIPEKNNHDIVVFL